MPKEPYTQTLAFRCDERLVKAVDKAARSEYSPPSDLMRRALAAHLRREGFDVNDEEA
jgi:predicted transcriptional regulator